MEKKIWKLADYDYWSYPKIGAGIRADFQQRLFDFILNSPKGVEIIKLLADIQSINKKKQNVNIYIPEHLKDNADANDLDAKIKENWSEILGVVGAINIRTQALITLQCVLHPCDGSPSVEESYNQATEEEVVEITNFFQGILPDKIKTSNIIPDDLNQKKKGRPKKEPI